MPARILSWVLGAEEEVNALPSHLASEGGVSASTQNQAMAALLTPNGPRLCTCVQINRSAES
jgi:hypothetical protein